MATNSPAEISISKSSSTVRSPNAMLTLLIATETPREQRRFSAAISPELQTMGKVTSYGSV
jgi:hypothetical protein